MALTECRECEHKVSNEALACPGCGAMQPAMTDADKKRAVQHSGFARSRMLAGGMFFGGIAWLVFAAVAGRDIFVTALGPAKWLIVGGLVWYIIAEVDRNLAERKSKKK